MAESVNATLAAPALGALTGLIVQIDLLRSLLSTMAIASGRPGVATRGQCSRWVDAGSSPAVVAILESECAVLMRGFGRTGAATYLDRQDAKPEISAGRSQFQDR